MTNSDLSSDWLQSTWEIKESIEKKYKQTEVKKQLAEFARIGREIRKKYNRNKRDLNAS